MKWKRPNTEIVGRKWRQNRIVCLSNLIDGRWMFKIFKIFKKSRMKVAGSGGRMCVVCKWKANSNEFVDGVGVKVRVRRRLVAVGSSSSFQFLHSKVACLDVCFNSFVHQGIKGDERATNAAETAKQDHDRVCVGGWLVV